MWILSGAADHALTPSWKKIFLRSFPYLEIRFGSLLRLIYRIEK